MKIKEPEVLNSVLLFHKTFKQSVEETPTLIAETRSKLRISLISEELKELEQAIKDNNLVEIADALCDIVYVVGGTVIEFGLGEKFKELFDEVQRSNMSKACKTYQEAWDTIDHYTEKGVESYAEKQDNDTYLVFRKEDDKTLKSINYSPADLKTILEA